MSAVAVHAENEVVPPVLAGIASELAGLSAAERVDYVGRLVENHVLTAEERVTFATEVIDDEVRAIDVLHARALVWKAQALRQCHRTEESRATLCAARILARQAEDWVEVCRTEAFLARLDSEDGELGTAVERLLKLRDELDVVGAVDAQLPCLHELATIAASSGANAVAVLLCRDAHKIAVASERPQVAAYHAIALAEMLAGAGRLDEAEDPLQRTLKLLAGRDVPGTRAEIEVELAWLRHQQGESGAAARRLELLAASQGGAVGRARRLLGEIYFALDRPRDCVEQIDLGILDAGDGPWFYPEIIRVRALARIGRVDVALETIDTLLQTDPLPERVLVCGLDARAEILGGIGKLREANESLREAVAASSRASVSEARARDTFLAIWNGYLESHRDDTLKMERTERAVDERLERQRHWRYGTIIAGLLGILGVWYFGRIRHRRRLADQALEASAGHSRVLAWELSRRTDALRQEMESRQSLELELERNRQSESIAALTSGVAHDFNNLMTVVIATNEILAVEAGATLERDGQDLLEESTRAAQAGADLAHQLLGLTRRQARTPRTMIMEGFFLEVEGLLRRAVGESIELSIRVHSPKASVFVDQTQLTSALINLCSNARDAMAGRGCIEIDVTSVPSAGSELGMTEVAVRDSGVGMSAAQIEKACMPLFTTKPPGEGTGLGLSVVSAFLSEAKGSIRIESEVGAGTTVRMALPTKRGADAPRVVVKPKEARLDGFSVLIVEDKSAVLRSVTRAVQMLGCTVIGLRSAERAKDRILAGLVPDVLLSDIQMPGALDGLELARWVRDRNPSLPIVLMTGSSDHGISSFPVIAKPFTVTKLSLALQGEVDQSDWAVHVPQRSGGNPAGSPSSS